MGEGIRLRRFACRAALLCLLCLHKEEEEEKRRNQNHLTPLSRPHTHTLDIYYLAPSSCEQLLAVAFVHPLPPPASAPAPAPPPARARVTMAARQFYRKLCKDLPTIMEMYKLDELTSIGTLRNTLKELFYQNKKYTDPSMINVMVHKAQAETPRDHKVCCDARPIQIKSTTKWLSRAVLCFKLNIPLQAFLCIYVKAWGFI